MRIFDDDEWERCGLAIDECIQRLKGLRRGMRHQQKVGAHSPPAEGPTPTPSITVFDAVLIGNELDDMFVKAILFDNGARLNLASPLWLINPGGFKDKRVRLTLTLLETDDAETR